jgi:hypothetical protein
MSLRLELGPKSLTVKTTPNTTLASVLAEFCKKYDLNPNEWTLYSKNKELDLSLTYRLSGLVPNSTLELRRRKIDESGLFMFLLVFIFEFSLVSFRFLILCFMKN